MNRMFLDIKRVWCLFFLLLFSSGINAQEADEETEEGFKKKEQVTFIGVNIGAFFANKNTAIIYSGSDAVTPYGIQYVFNQVNLQPTFDAYFKYPYSISEYPQQSSYRTALDLGFHAGVNLNKTFSLFTDLNFSRLRYEQVFTVAIDDPTIGVIGLTYEQIPILGEEQRSNINLGVQYNVERSETTKWYLAAFGNFNSIRLQRNFFVVNGQEYQIVHGTPGFPDQRPGMSGNGLGIGTGIKYRLSNAILVDFAYNLYYITSRMNDTVKGTGISHGVVFRIIWG